MLRNKIYKHITFEVLRIFFTILFAFTLIAWTVRAVNYLNLIIDDAHSISTYFVYSFLNISNIATKFIPISFLLALIIVIYRFKNQKEFLIIWSMGISKIHIVNLIIGISIVVVFLNLILSTYVTPYALNYSRVILKTSDLNQVSSAIKENDFTDTFKNVTFFIDKKDENNEFENIFIRDNSNSLTGLLNDETAKDKTITAKRGYIENDKLILFDGIIHSYNDTTVTSLKFKKTEILIDLLQNRTIQQPKLRETKTETLILCLFGNERLLLNCPLDKIKTEVIETTTRRLVMPIYIILMTLVVCYTIFSKQEKEVNNLKRNFIFILGFLIILISEMFIRYTGKSELYAISYLMLPFIISPLVYLLLIYKSLREKMN